MYMFLERVCLVASVLTVAAVTPRRISRSMKPPWHLPCGDDLDLKRIDSSEENLEEELGISLENLSLQHKLTLNDYLNRDYEYLYERVRIGVHDYQYIPNWVPGEKDVNLVRPPAN